MMNIVIPMAGLGDRFKREGYTKPKPLIDVNGKPMIQRAIESLGLEGQYIFIINNQIEEYEELKKLLNEITNKPVIIDIDYLTEGPAATALLARKFIYNTDRLVIANCDQIMEWNADDFTKHIMETDSDGVVVTYPIQTPKNSYIQLDEKGYGVRVAEKEMISEHSLNGIHYWRFGFDFVLSAEWMIQADVRVNNEFYIAPTYNEMIECWLKITTYPIKLEEHWAVGTPEDLQKYLDHAKV
jgi:NDP-sugar pyrophosphorylase family protein